MKKIIALLTLCLCIVTNTAYAKTLVDITKVLLEKNGVEVTEDVSGINRLQNRRSLKNPAIISAAIKSGVIVAKKGIVIEDGTDFTPLTDALVKKYITDNQFKIVSGKQVDLLRNQNIIFNENTFFVTENQSVTDLNYTDVYTCIINRGNKAFYVWKATEVVQPTLYRGKLYWAEDGEIILSTLYRKGFDSWIKESKIDSLLSLDGSEVGISEDFIMKNLDKEIYIFADNYGGEIKVKGIFGGDF